VAGVGAGAGGSEPRAVTREKGGEVADIDPDKCQSFIDDDHKLCPRCSKERPCCQIVFDECPECGGDGYVEDYDPGSDEPYDEPCQLCNGKGGWWECLGRCDENGQHAPQTAEA
jgi:hypothetical protein